MGVADFEWVPRIPPVRRLPITEKSRSSQSCFFISIYNRNKRTLFGVLQTNLLFRGSLEQTSFQKWAHSELTLEGIFLIQRGGFARKYLLNSVHSFSCLHSENPVFAKYWFLFESFRIIVFFDNIDLQVFSLYTLGVAGESKLSPKVIASEIFLSSTISRYPLLRALCVVFFVYWPNQSREFRIFAPIAFFSTKREFFIFCKLLLFWLSILHWLSVLCSVLFCVPLDLEGKSYPQVGHSLWDVWSLWTF